MSRARQQRRSEEVRGRILSIAGRILSEEGEEALSIRRITQEMDYSAGIVYHYFDSKEEILACVLEEEHRRILAPARPPDPSAPPGEAIRAVLLGMIYNGLTHTAETKALLFNASPRILPFTSVLGAGRCDRRPALHELVHALEAGVAAGLFAPCDVHRTAQVLWSAVFGLLARLIVEQNVPPEQRAGLIERQMEILLRGLRK